MTGDLDGDHPRGDPGPPDLTTGAELRRIVAAAGRAELCWSGPSGPSVSVETPLWHDGAVWAALPYSRRAPALAAAEAGEVALLLRSARTTEAPARLLRGSVRLVEDPDGDVFVPHLLGQHLARHAPSRALADSVLLRREHWWYVPRLLLRVDVAAVQERPGPDWLLLGRRADGSPSVTGVQVGERSPHAPDAVNGPALLHAARASEDQERTVEARVGGELVDGVFRAHDGTVEVPPVPALPAALGLLARWRRQRALEAACLAGLRAAGHA